MGKLRTRREDMIKKEMGSPDEIGKKKQQIVDGGGLGVR